MVVKAHKIQPTRKYAH